MTTLQANRVLECEGLACPMPVVRTKKVIEELEPGDVLEVRTTDQGSVADIPSWANRTGHQYIGMKEEGQIFRHFIRKSKPEEMKAPTSHGITMTNEELHGKLAAGEKINVIDVREPAEYAFGHIPNAISIPFGQLEQRLGELNPDEAYAIVCRTGNRSDLACQLLTDKGFKSVTNVLPGMAEWSFEVEQDS